VEGVYGLKMFTGEISKKILKKMNTGFIGGRVLLMAKAI